MGAKVKWKCVSLVVFLFEFVQYLPVNGLYIHDSVPSVRFTQVLLSRSEVLARSRRDASQVSGHADHVQVKVQLDGQPHVVDLVLNKQLLAKDIFLRTDHANGTNRVHRFGPQTEELCHYQGKVRGLPSSRAAISLCDGVRGMVVLDPQTTYYLEPGPTPEQTLVYNSNHLIHSSNYSCGFSDTPHSHRVRREAEEIRGPYNENEDSRYVELVMVVDLELYKEKDSDLQKVYRHCKDIANIINSFFVPLNIFIALVGVVVWTEENQINLTTNGDNTLTQFLLYRKERLVKDHPNDNAQLLTKVKFEGGVVGKALKGPICTYEFSGGVSTDHSTVLGLVATTVAHEMGHNFGMEHDNADCQCPDEKCIMAPSSSNVSPTHWSSCSLDHLALAFEHGMDYCLRNKPKQLFDSPQCGNGFVEAGEQCDCGLSAHCANPCCNPNTCMLHPNATCATGRCCDLQTCQPKSAGLQCRRAERECDLPEFCTGESEYCPADVFKLDGETCRKGKAYCYNGKCRTHADQCRLLWGDSGSNSDDECYGKNMLGTRHGNCGYHRPNQTYIKCINMHVQCGMLHCKHQNERLEFGMESVSILAHTFINKKGAIVPCRTAIVDLGLNDMDPGLSPDGAKCAEDMMCVNQKCMSVASLRTRSGVFCPDNCNGNGVCNNKGHCHCDKGFAPPSCTDPGIGGSQDSGPIADPNAIRKYKTALYVIFLCVIPLLAAASCGYLYWKRDPRVYRQRKPASTPSSNALLDMRGISKGGKGESSDHTSLSASTLLEEGQPVGITPLQKELIGQFKGFSIKPIEKEEDQYQAVNLLLNNSRAPAPLASVKSPTVRTQNKWNNATAVRPPAAPNVSFKSPKPKQRFTTEEACKVDVGSLDIPDGPHRVEISQPVLEGTTSCAAKELIEGPLLQPSRPAPPAPAQSGVPDQEAPLPPVQEPTRDFPTLTKIANIMRNASMKRNNDKSNKPKIDREKLRGLEISHPIPQVEDAEKEPTSPTPSIQRAQSMRESTPPRQPIMTFGSMRNGKRPTSVHVPARPTAPPPRPPPQPPQPPPKDYSYDDCLHLIIEKQAPLAHIDDDASPKRGDNIYAVIEESPPSKPEKVVRFTDDRYEVPKSAEPIPISPLLSGSALNTSNESMGLLGEIVNEIQTRNVESIYSAGTLKRKKKEAEQKRLNEAGRYENAGVADDAVVYQPSDVSSTSSSNGYLNPKNINMPSMPPVIATVGASPVTVSPADALSEKKQETEKLKDIDLANYKPYSSSFVRSSGPLSMAYSKKPESTTDSATFARPSLLGTPTPAKFTPHSITSSFRMPKTSSSPGAAQTSSLSSSSNSESAKSDAAAPSATSTFKPSLSAFPPPNNDISSENSKSPNPPVSTIKPIIEPAKSETKLAVQKLGPKTAPRPKDSSNKTQQRPLPSIPKKPSESLNPMKPLPAIPKAADGGTAKSLSKRPSDVSRIGKPNPPSAASKPKLHPNA